MSQVNTGNLVTTYWGKARDKEKRDFTKTIITKLSMTSVYKIIYMLVRVCTYK